MCALLRSKCAQYAVSSIIFMEEDTFGVRGTTRGGGVYSRGISRRPGRPTVIERHAGATMTPPTPPPQPPRPFRTIARLALIAFTVGTIGLAFAWTAGWLSPARLSGADVADVLEQHNGEHPGFRRAQIGRAHV